MNKTCKPCNYTLQFKIMTIFSMVMSAKFTISLHLLFGRFKLYVVCCGFFVSFMFKVFERLKITLLAMFSTTHPFMETSFSIQMKKGADDLYTQYAMLFFNRSSLCTRECSYSLNILLIHWC